MFNKFLLFRAQATIILLLFLIAAAPLLSCASPAPESPGGGAAEQWLAAHNRYRCMHGVPALEWSSNLEEVASWRVNNCGHCEHCLCQGASCQPLFSGQYAENATCWGAGPQEAVDAWYSEEANYDYDNPVWGPDTGHFINVVANSGQKVGCACNASHCYCDYDAQYGTSASALKQVVPKPVKTAAECGL